MNYIQQIVGFEKQNASIGLSSHAKSMYYTLLYKNNILGWRKTYTIPNSVLQAEAGIKHRTTFNEARKELIDNNLITYLKGKQGKSGTYSIKELNVQDDVQVYVQEDVQVHVQDNVQDDVQVHGTLNKLNKTKLNKNNNIYINSERANTREVAKFVFLKSEEIEKLIEETNEEITNRAIELISIYKQENEKTRKGKKAYKNDYLAIRKWALARAKHEIEEEEIRQKRLAKIDTELQISKEKADYYNNKKAYTPASKQVSNAYFSGDYSKEDEYWETI